MKRDLSSHSEHSKGDFLLDGSKTALYEFSPLTQSVTEHSKVITRKCYNIFMLPHFRCVDDSIGSPFLVGTYRLTPRQRENYGRKTREERQ